MKTNLLLQVFICSLVLQLLSSCSPKIISNSNSSTRDYILFPQEQDTAYVQYLTAIASASDLSIQSKFTSAIVGKEINRTYIKPYGVAVQKNKVYVSDIGLKGLNIIDLENKKFTQFSPQSRDVNFVLNSFVDDNGDRYIMDTKFKMVVVYDENGKYISKFSIEESERPTDIFIKNDKIYVTALYGKRINIYDKVSHELIDYIPKNVTKDDEAYIYQPLDLYLTDEYIYVVDAGAFKVKIYNYDGTFVKSFGTLGKGPGQFNRPKSVVVDNEGIIYVSDSTHGNVQMFNEDGQLLMYFGNARENFTGLVLPTSMAIDYNNLEFFKKYVDPEYNLKYVIYVVCQQGAVKLRIFGRIEKK